MFFLLNTLLSVNVKAVPVTLTVYDPCIGVVCPSYCEGYDWKYDGYCQPTDGNYTCIYATNPNDVPNCGGTISQGLYGIGSGTGNFIVQMGSPVMVLLILLALSGAIAVFFYSLFAKVAVESE
jgi:hypothetical protein